ncbi:aldose 1-epimerase [Parabacteroides sp. PH5-13]|uniref:aldose epimerase family protein n=1 Tax=unclassified Parabacteroides TaxID=2649774 RepID=UPI0024735987|nr:MULTISPECIES: aldose epimerase family protein [unclassified Parabacteroides]MDH6305240.1 aldose 1-epimerase [Parabacteroides sp. PH5-39]MDH6320227.1 aldose 1-epimerase [Parabacteroides sp. PH5-13]MDH6323830.1 aldose 1-epimerase [Parabacteroides sp. PH5-8]MDH6384942.1 aldose 1-epimerase [Parabacteroides sp. PH5-17]MDH6394424.1 aldose 1-epimerase [Parabacteroides sp. PFB2-22]
MKRLSLAALAMCMLLSCGEKKATEELTVSGLKKADFVSTTADGKTTDLYVLKNKNGVEACITNYGGRLVSMMVPDKNGKLTDVVLGYDNISDYLSIDGNYGALIGRYGNRIANASFTLDDVEYTLPKNDSRNCLHGGPKGYHTRIWDAKQTNDQTLELVYLSQDGEAGFPGNLNIKVTYTLTDNNAIDILYEATTDKPTIVNLTNHSYFNLSGVAGSKILDQQIIINADNYTPVDGSLIPTGIAPVEGTPLDLRMPIAIGAQIDDSFEQMQKGRGYDHNWVLNTNCDINTLAAKAVSLTSGIALEVYTNEPGIQFYTGNFMTGADKGKHGVVYPHRGAFCLETQHYPNSPNTPDFPSTVLRPSEKYKSQCIYKFTVQQ